MGWLMTVLLMGTSTVVNGLVTAWLWYWFLVPLGLPVVGVAQGAGIGLLVSFLTDHTRVGQVMAESDTETLTNTIWYMLPFPLMALAMGWVIHLFMG